MQLLRPLSLSACCERVQYGGYKYTNELQFISKYLDLASVETTVFAILIFLLDGPLLF